MREHGQVSWWGWQSRLREEQELRLFVGGVPGKGTSGDRSHGTAWLPNLGPDTPISLLSLHLGSMTLTHPAHSWCNSDFENRIHSFNTSKIGTGIYPAAKKKKKNGQSQGPLTFSWCLYKQISVPQILTWLSHQEKA